ncbi:hypothetical protein [Thalassotalea ganghwensis]
MKSVNSLLSIVASSLVLVAGVNANTINLVQPEPINNAILKSTVETQLAVEMKLNTKALLESNLVKPLLVKADKAENKAQPMLAKVTIEAE